MIKTTFSPEEFMGVSNLGGLKDIVFDTSGLESGENVIMMADPPVPFKYRILYAASYGTIEQVQELIAEGVDVNVEDEDGCNATTFAVRRGHEEILRILIKAGAKFKGSFFKGKKYGKNNRRKSKTI